MCPTIRLKDNFTLVPNDLYLVMDSDEQVIIMQFIRLQGVNQDSKPTCYAKLLTICEYLRTTSKNKAEKVIQSLLRRGYIGYIQGNSRSRANEYWVNMDKILFDIRKCKSLEEIDELAHRELSVEQKLILAKQTIEKNGDVKDVTDLCVSKGIIPVDKKTGEELDFKGQVGLT